MSMVLALDNLTAATRELFENAIVDDGSVSHVVRLSKNAKRTLSDDVLETQTDAIVARVDTAQRKLRSWTFERQDMDGESWYSREYVNDSASRGHYTYHVALRIECHPERKRKTIESEFQNILATLTSAGRRFSGEPWLVTALDGMSYTVKAPDEVTDEDLAAEIGYAPFHLPDDFESYFTDLYGLDDQIALVKAAIEAAVASNWRNRFNCVLVGPPGCGKTNLCQLIKKAVGEESVLEFDGTSTTAAGAQKELSERDELPRLLLIEEIEKAPEGSLSWLLSLTDNRAEIRKTTARGNIMRDVKMLAICTVNDYPTFQRVAFGALASRFKGNPIGFMRPSREIRRRILKREISRVEGGNEAWIDKAIEFHEQIGSDDPRELIAICMCGRDDLLTGEYQRKRLATAINVTITRTARDQEPEYAF